MGMRVLASRRTPPPPGFADPLVDRYYSPAGLLEMIAQCDYVVVTAPLTPQTRGMIGAREFAAMKPGAVIDQRGPRPGDRRTGDDPGAHRKAHSGAALDVFASEPLPAGHPLFALENVLLSPHSADHTPDWLERAMQFLPVAVRTLLRGRAAAERGG